MDSGRSWVGVYIPTAKLWYCLEWRANRVATRGIGRNIFLAPLSLCLRGMWPQVKLCWAWCPLSKGCKRQIPCEPLTAFPELAGRIENIKKARNDLGNTANPTPATGFYRICTNWVKNFLWRKGFVLYLHLAAAETMNGSPQGIWNPDWKKHTSLPLGLTTFSPCCQQKVKGCSEAGMLGVCYLC